MPLTPSISKLNSLHPVPSSIAKQPMSSYPNSKFSHLPQPPRMSRLPPRPPPSPRRVPIFETFPHDLRSSRSSSIGSMRSRSSSPYSSRHSLSISSSNNSTPRPSPHRSFPQKFDNSDILDYSKMRSLEQSPVVYDANLSFVMGVNKSLKQSLHASAAHTQKQTASNYLTEKISNFLEKTDHIMEEWKSVGRSKSKSELSEREAKKSKSASNIYIRGFQLARHQPSSLRKSRNNSLSRESRDTSLSRDDDDDTICEDQVQKKKAKPS